jgi:DNA/RNA-binding domain of Phe-tRNA-synthetase-like protein
VKKIVINEELLKRIPLFKIGVIEFNAKVFQNNDLDLLIEETESEIRTKYSLSDVLEIPNIKCARDGYRLLGKDPSRYRLAVESLYRRIVKNNRLYRINNVVDLGNVLSLKTKKSVAVLDLDKIQGDIDIKIGKNEIYEGIGRGIINIENIPIYSDEMGPFGSTTSDTMRSMITLETTKVLVFMISFNGMTELQNDIKICIDLYQQYADGVDFKHTII